LGEIVALRYRRILDSRGNPTVECDVWTHDGFGTAAAPSGASTGENEVTAFPKGSVKEGIRQARSRVLPALEGVDVADQAAVDRGLEEADGTPDFDSIGGNVAVATSLACAKAAASEQGQPLHRHLGGALATRMPMPFGNVLGGGAHAIGGTDVQEFMAVPMSRDPEEAVFAQARVHREVSRILSDRLPDTPLGKGDEGAWIAPVSDEEALEVVEEACDFVGEDLGMDLGIALDVAASELWNGEAYEYRDTERSTDEQLDLLEDLIGRFPVVSVEDPFHEEDVEAHADLTDAVGDDVLVVGDDLFATDEDRLRRGVEEAAANAILIKPNQVGTLTRTVRTVQAAHKAGFKTVMSHRSGETPDATIAHLAVALGCHAIKTGAVGGERTAKLNELIRIDERTGAT
jgi:enolase